MEEKKATMLKVVGIICIVFGAIATVTSILGKVGVGAILTGVTSGFEEIPEMANAMDSWKKIASSMNLGLTIAVIGAIVMLVAGIMGVVSHKKPEKAMMIIILGVLLIIFAVLPVVMGMMTVSNIEKLVADLGDAGTYINPALFKPNMILSAVNLVLPILYLIGGLKLKKLGEE